MRISYRLPQAILMRRETCRYPGNNPTTTYTPFAFSFSEYLEREGGDRTGLSFDLESRGVLYSLRFLGS